MAPISSSETLVLELGHVIMSFALLFMVFGAALLVLGTEHLWFRLKKKDIRKLTATWRKEISDSKIQKILFVKSKEK